MPKSRKSRLHINNLGKLVPVSNSVVNSHGLTLTLLQWEPDCRVLPLKYKNDKLKIPIRMIVLEDGTRLFRPPTDVASLRIFLKKAALAGFEIGKRTEIFDPEQVFSHRIMSTVFDWTFGSKLFLNAFLSKKHLTVKNLEFAFSCAQLSNPPTLLDLFHQGCSSQNFAGYRNSAKRNCIFQMGIVENLWHRKFKASTPCALEDIRRELEYSLVSNDTGQRIRDPKIIESLDSVFTSMYQNHLNDPDDLWNHWFKDDPSNLIRSVRLRKETRSINENQIRYYFRNYLPVRSHYYVSKCVSLFFWVISKLIDPELTDKERIYFARWFELRSELGGIVPICLHHRWNYVENILNRMDLEGDHVDESRYWKVLLKCLLLQKELVEGAKVERKSNQCKVTERILFKKVNDLAQTYKESKRTAYLNKKD
jgi:hypothetical protein